MHLDDVPFWVVEENLVPLSGKGRAVIGIFDSIGAEMRLESLDVVGAKGDMASFHRIDVPTVSGGDIEILLGEVHLHAAFGGELDMPVITGLVGSVGAWEMLWCNIIHLQDIDIEFVQSIDVLRDIIDVVEFKFQSGLRVRSRNMDPCAQFAPELRPFPDHEDQEAFTACDKIWQQFLADSSDKFNFVSKVVPYRGIVQYDFSWLFHFILWRDRLKVLRPDNGAVV